MYSWGGDTVADLRCISFWSLQKRVGLRSNITGGGLVTHVSIFMYIASLGAMLSNIYQWELRASHRQNKSHIDTRQTTLLSLSGIFPNRTARLVFNVYMLYNRLVKSTTEKRLNGLIYLWFSCNIQPATTLDQLMSLILQFLKIWTPKPLPLPFPSILSTCTVNYSYRSFFFLLTLCIKNH